MGVVPLGMLVSTSCQFCGMFRDRAEASVGSPARVWREVFPSARDGGVAVRAEASAGGERLVSVRNVGCVRGAGRGGDMGAAGAGTLPGAKRVVTSGGRRRSCGLSPLRVSRPRELLRPCRHTWSSSYASCRSFDPAFLYWALGKKGQKASMCRSDLRAGLCSCSNGVVGVSFSFPGLNSLIEAELRCSTPRASFSFSPICPGRLSGKKSERFPTIPRYL